MFLKKRRFGLIKNFSIVARLRVSALLALVAVIVTCTTGYIGLTQSNVGIERATISTQAILYQRQADMMHDALRADVLYAIQIGTAGSTETKKAINEDVGAHITEFREAIAALDALPLDAEVHGLIEEVRPLMDDYLAKAKTVAVAAFTDDAQSRALFATFMERFSALEAAMATLGDLIGSQGKSKDDAVRASNLVLLNIVMGAGTAACVILIVSNILLGRSITVPLNRVKDAIKEVALGNLGGRHSNFDRVSDLNDEVSEIAVHLEALRVRLRQAVEMEQQIRLTQESQEKVVTALSHGLERLSGGDLTERLDEPFADEYEALRANFNRTVEQLNSTMTRVVEVSRGIRSRADEIRDATEDLSHRTENQAATLEETAAAIDELATSVRSAASGAQEVEGIVQSARTEAQASGKVVMGAVEAMQGIEKSSEQIAQIIGVIDDIAFQTNLLALNAGVEAARAGDAGRGFAVVASEVRALAQRSANASKEIKQLIGASTQFVGRGVTAVGGAGKALTELVDRVSHISTLVSGIASGAAEQATAISEVNVGVTQLDQVAQRNAAMVEASMTTSQSLQQDAVELEQMVSHFTTDRRPANAQGNPLRPALAAPAPRLRAAG